MGEVHYMISEAAKRVNMETHVLRHWEEELSLKIGRTEMGHRYYTEEDIRLFRCIKELKEQGMVLKELKELVPEIVKMRAERQGKKPPMTELQQALLDNNAILQEAIIKALDEHFKMQNMQEEEHYKKLDCLIRQQQSNRKEYAQMRPIKQFKRIFGGT